MAFSPGSIAVVQIDSTAAGSLANISAYVSSFHYEQDRDISDLKVLGGNPVSRLVGSVATQGTIEGYFDPTVDEIFETAMNESTPVTRTLQFDPAGSATGARRFTGEAYISHYEVDTPGDDTSAWRADFVINGAWTQTTI